jgi:hypothetical protein
MKEPVMPPFSATLIGVIRGAANLYDMLVSDAMLYGGSGHAFLMHIHPELCPSGPDTWTMDGFFRQLRGVGISMTPCGFFGPDSSAAQRREAEAWVRQRMEAGVPCSLLNLEHQLITGIDAEGMQTAQPWPGMAFPPARLTFGSWAELGKDIHITFFSLQRTNPLPAEHVVKNSLRYALDLYDQPQRHQAPGCAVGAGAWAAWIEAVGTGHGSSHGSWWNSMVWSECRERAGDYFDEIARCHAGSIPGAAVLAEEYRRVGAALREAGLKETPDARRLSLLATARDAEAVCIQRIRESIK